MYIQYALSVGIIRYNPYDPNNTITGYNNSLIGSAIPGIKLRNTDVIIVLRITVMSANILELCNK